ncbi:MAG: hypothetical protein ACXVYY_09500 [Oryzihumus sp.]
MTSWLDPQPAGDGAPSRQSRLHDLLTRQLSGLAELIDTGQVRAAVESLTNLRAVAALMGQRQLDSDLSHVQLQLSHLDLPAAQTTLANLQERALSDALSRPATPNPLATTA